MNKPKKRLNRIYQDRAGLYNVKTKPKREYVMYSEEDYFLAEYVIHNNLPFELLDDLHPKSKDFNEAKIKALLVKGEEYVRIPFIGDHYAITSYGRIVNSSTGKATKPIVTGNNILYTLNSTQAIVQQEFQKNNWPYDYQEILDRFERNKWPYKDIRTTSSYYFPKGTVLRHRKAVMQYDLEGTFIREYESVGEAKDVTGYTSGIRECCRGVRENAHGYIWKYK